MEETDLLELITKDDESISNYLSDVPTYQFIQDVKKLLKKALINML